MYPEALSSLNATIVTAGFGLAWFIVGVLAGRALPRGGTARPARVRQPRTRGGGDSSSGGSGKVEIYVGNLSYEVSDKDLRRRFESFGKVASARVIENKFNGKSKGFGFVEMSERQEAEAAIKALNGKAMRGRKLVVNEAKTRSRDD